MEGHRRYADEPEPVWFSGPGQYSTSSQPSYDSDAHERPISFRLPEQRDAEYVQRSGEYAPRDGEPPRPDGYPRRDGEHAWRAREYAQRDGEYARPDGEYPQRETDYPPQSHYAGPDPATSAGSRARSATAEPASAVQESMPVPGPVYPAIRPTGATSLADAPPPTAYGGGFSAPTSATPAPGPAIGTSAPGPGIGGSAPGPGIVASAPGPGIVTSAEEPTGAVSPIAPFAPEPTPSDGVYRTRRPGSAVLVAVGTTLLLVPALLLLVRATFVDDPVARGIVPAVLLTLGLPLTGLGLYAMAGGGPVGRDAWLRPPIVYLPIGLVLLVAAGLAVT